jgi:L-fucose isomerase-like protein
MKTRVKVVFPANRPDRPSWPYIGYDVEKRSKEVLSVLKGQLPEFEFSPGVYYFPEEAEHAFQEEQGRFDGYLVYMTALWSGIAEFYVRNARPVIVADELYSGSGGLLRIYSLINKEHLPAIGVASSDFQDVVDAVRLFGVMKAMRQANILVVADGETWGARQEVLSRALDIFGTRVEQMNSEALKAYYEKVDADEAGHWKEKWIQEALKVVEPDEAEILRSARMYLALKAAMQDAQAHAVTVDCLGLYYGGKLFAYPCLGFFQLNNEGSTGVCEADVDSTLTQLLIRYLTGRPGYVSDPVIDTATGQIVYAHCVATNRVFGPHGLANPYLIRSHAEDRKGASVQSLLPLGRQVTTLKVSAEHKAFAIHTGRTVANVEDDKACRTKLAAEVDAQRILDNYHSELFGWHRVTCYGEYRKQLIDLATLYGLDVLEEDR